jgi:thiol:disulfide interchange protein DsbA
MKAGLAFLLAICLAGCSHESTPAPAAPESAPTASSRTSGASAANAPATTLSPTGSSGAVDLATAAKTQQESADTATTTDSTEVSLEKLASLPSAGQLPAGSWVAGKNYDVLSPAQPTDVPAGKVEVVELFWYACPHCYAIDGAVESWRKNKPAYIEFRRVPVTWNEEHRAHARLFYTLQALGKLDQLHGKVFDDIHQKGDLLFVPGDNKGTVQKQVDFAKANGISESDFVTAYNGMGVQLKVQQADDLARRYRVDSVPTFVIDGKYVTDVGMAGDTSKLMHLIDDLAASEKHH